MISRGDMMDTEKTVDSCFIMPILPHKIGNVRDFWDDVSEKFRSDTEDRLKDAGIKRLLVFLQAIPNKGDFMVFFMQSKDSLENTFSRMFTAGGEYSKYLANSYKDFSGIDMSKRENVPKIEKMFDWDEKHEFMEEKDMLLKPWCYAVPVLPGKTEEAKKFIKDQESSKLGEMEKFLRDQDVIRRLVFLQRTSQGDFIVQHMLMSQYLDEFVHKLTSCSQELCDFIKKGSTSITGKDMTDVKNLPNVELLFKWDEKNGFKTAEQIIAYTE
jgi:hypothetical protein